MKAADTQTLRLTVGVESLVGRQRSANEDSYAAFAPEHAERDGLEGLLLVADGMGGEQAGEVASRLATEALREWAQGLDSPEVGQATLEATTRGLEQSIRAANLAILEHGRLHPEAEGLGTTLVVAALFAGNWLVAHVGDSRCYRLRGGSAELLTVDHTWVEQQVRAGILSADEAADHPQAHVLTRSLGSTASDEPELLVEPARVGDVLVLCSDGLSGSVGSDDLLAFQADDPQAMAERLAALANERDGSDNITVVVGRVDGAGAAAAPLRSAPSPLPRRLLPVAASIALLASGYAAGTFQRGLTLEERAEALLEQAEVDLAEGREAEAEQRLTLAETLFRDAPQAVEARRRLEEHFSAEPQTARPTSSAQPIEAPRREVAGSEGAGTEPAEPDTSTAVPSTGAQAPAEGDGTPSEAAAAEARAADSSSSSTEERNETTNTPSGRR